MADKSTENDEKSREGPVNVTIWIVADNPSEIKRKSDNIGRVKTIFSYSMQDNQPIKRILKVQFV